MLSPCYFVRGTGVIGGEYTCTLIHYQLALKNNIINYIKIIKMKMKKVIQMIQYRIIVV